MSTGLADAHLPWLVADIGGTNARFGLVRDAQLEVGSITTLRCADYAGPAQAVQRYLADLATRLDGDIQPHRGAFAVASASIGDRVELTNSGWSFSCHEVADALAIESLEVINDFEALALALPQLGADDYRCFGGPAPTQAPLPKAVLGPGTGLGVAGVVPTPFGWIAVRGEGGHATLSAVDDFEAELLRAARADFAHVSAERLLSGIGLPVLLKAIARVRGQAAEPLSAEEITERAAARSDALCVLAIDTFAAMLGGFAGNVALTLGARGGVFIGGGIVPKLGDAFAHDRFRARFEAKGRFASYLAAIPTAVITAAHPALAGAARAIDNRLRSGAQP